MLKTSQLWMPCPQDPMFQHLLEPETGIEGAIKIPKKISKALYVEQNPEIHVKSFQTFGC